jgi:tetratricopeptide (TPR) repeat protein
MKPVCILTLAAIVAIMSLQNAWAQKPGTSPMDRVMDEMKAGNSDKVIEALNDAIKQQPNNADAYLLRASLKAAGGDLVGALADFNKVIELKPDSGSPYATRALLRLGNQDLTGALKDLDTAIANNYKGDHVYSLRAQLKAQMGDLKGARADLDEAIKANPDNPRLYFDRAQVCTEMEDSEHAIADYDYLLTWYETNPNKRARSKLRDGDPRSKDDPNAFAVGLYAEAPPEAPGDKEMLPRIATSYFNRGIMQSRRGKTDEAISDLTNAMRLDPANAWPYYHRADAYENKGDLKAALADVNKGLQVDSTNANLKIERGVILVLLGKNEEAKHDFAMFLNEDRPLWQKRIDTRLAAVKNKVSASKPN